MIGQVFIRQAAMGQLVQAEKAAALLGILLYQMKQRASEKAVTSVTQNTISRGRDQSDGKQDTQYIGFLRKPI